MCVWNSHCSTIPRNTQHVEGSALEYSDHLGYKFTTQDQVVVMSTTVPEVTNGREQVVNFVEYFPHKTRPGALCVSDFKKSGKAWKKLYFGIQNHTIKLWY